VVAAAVMVVVVGAVIVVTLAVVVVCDYIPVTRLPLNTILPLSMFNMSSRSYSNTFASYQEKLP
jgi:hypothetical protein